MRPLLLRKVLPIWVLAQIACTTCAVAQTENILYAFSGKMDGGGPSATLVADMAGNVYGTTTSGGEHRRGTVFEVSSSGTETVLYSFQGHKHKDGAYPWGPLTMDAAGNLYGTTTGGGKLCTANNGGCGTVFKLSPTGTETVLHAFTGGTDGAVSFSGLAIDKAGNLYGTTYSGGGTGCGGDGCGTVFKVRSDGKETVLHAFVGGSDGANPISEPFRDTSGDLYGVTSYGGENGEGCPDDGCGTIFKVTSAGSETVLYAFAGESDGATPQVALIADKDGNLYGTTNGGGATDCGCGTVFKFGIDGAKTTLYSFGGGNDGDSPYGSLILDKNGNLYGTTYGGAGTGCFGQGCGTVFQLAPDGTERLLHVFAGGNDGSLPGAGLIRIGTKFYGTTVYGGGRCVEYGCGTVFTLTR